MVSEIYYYNQNQLPSIASDYMEAKTRAEKITHQPKTSENTTIFTELLQPIPFVRRTASIPDKLKNGNVATALGMASLAIINGPEDLRDIRSSYRQITSWLKGEHFEGAYDFTKYQHPFSFFRGTHLKNIANPNTSSNPKLARKILDSDKTLAETTFGKKILNFLGVKRVDKIITKIEAINSTKENPKFIKANVYEGKSFGKLTAHMMERSTKWGIIATAALELPKITEEFFHGDNFTEKVENGTKQVIKSGMNVVAETLGIGYMGAIGAKLGPAGSLVGMGAGAIIGGYGSRKLQDLVS